MTYEYTLCKKHIDKYGFTHLLVNGWFGIYAHNMNQFYDERISSYVKNKVLTDKDIDLIVKYSKEIKEY